MSHALGVYYAPEHGRQSDKVYIAKLQPVVVRILEPDIQQIADIHMLAPNAVIATRTWAIDDNSGSAVRSLMDDPVRTGIDHANQYRGQLDRWKREAAERGLVIPIDSYIMFNAANEPNQGGTPDKIAQYNIAFLNRCTELGIRATALCLGVGWPGNHGPDTPVDWNPYLGLVEPIRRGNHWLELHEYYYKSGPQDGWTWLAGRHLQCPLDVPILLGEVGVDNYVDAQRWHAEGGNRGWVGNMSPDSYAAMTRYHIRGSDTRVIAALPFITDYRSNMWESFDTSSAHQAFLEIKDQMIPQIKFSTSSGGDVVTEPIPSSSNWERSITWILKWEGGFQDNPNDVGNYYNGKLVGTKYGISAASWGGQYDIPNLTLDQAKEIYFKNYWQASGSDKLDWPLCLLVFDTAVLHGLGTAKTWLNEVGLNPYKFAAKRLQVYTKLGNWNVFGAGWVNRTAELLAEMG